MYMVKYFYTEKIANMDRLSFYRNFYEQPGIRNEDIGSEERVSIALEMVPLKINSCLDIGCGDGTVLDKLSFVSFKVALDISYNILMGLKTENKILSCSNALPFRSNYYDLIVCTEVLEHLQHKEFELTINEIERVAKKYILISVPYQEDLSRKQTLCPKCSHIFHIHMHMRNFTLLQIEKLYKNFYLERYVFSKTQEKAISPWLLKIRRKYGHRWEWDENALCPRCGYKNIRAPGRTPISILTSMFAEFFSKNHPKWIVALYKKK
jgi:ubiquinone/menaquinone biosynthesis C-methylase UbiE